MYKLASLFDGSGGFPLAGTLCGIRPVWASEVEPYPIAVTRERFPGMAHKGDISKINGAEVEPVDIITFGSPCQDLSIAGKCAGLKHTDKGDEETTRSGLFMEAVRIIKEMRESTNGEYPRFALWENVLGAFSSNKGEDFRTVLEELIKIVEPSAVMPAVPKNGWPYADSYCGDGWSFAYRVFDAQYWGVPQRRRRIHLVLDLRGERAREVLFEREVVRECFAQSGSQREAAASHAENCAGADDRAGESAGVGGRGLDAVKAYTLKIRCGCEGVGKGALLQEDKSATLTTNNDQYLFRPVPNLLLDDQGGHPVNVCADNKCPTLRAEAHGNLPCALEAAGFKAGQGAQACSIGWENENCPTLAAEASVPSVCIKECLPFDTTQVTSPQNGCNPKCGDSSHTLSTDSRNILVEPVYCLQGNCIDRTDTARCKSRGWREDTSYTLTTIDRPAVAYCTDVGFLNSQEDVSPTLLARQYKDPHLISYKETEIQYIVRRLTPTECARLQGFPDAWGHIPERDSLTDEECTFWQDVRDTYAVINGKPQKDYTATQLLTWYNKLHTDSAEYKMWGNGIALPPALYCMQGIVDALDASTGDDDWMN